MTTFTGSPDAHVETSTVDGHVERDPASEDFATILAGAGDGNVDQTDPLQTILRASTTTDEYTLIKRIIILVDTASIPDTDTIDSGTLDTWGVTTADQFMEAGSISLVASTPASNTDLADADYGQLGTTKFAADILISNLNTGVTKNTQTLNATGLAAVDATGITKLGIRLRHENDDEEPTWESDKRQRYDPHSAEGTAGEIPLLTIIHSSAGTTRRYRLPLMGVG